MSSSLPQSPSAENLPYTATSSSNSFVTPVSSGNSEATNCRLEEPGIWAGSLNDAAMIRDVLVQSIKRSGKTRAAIAEEMAFLLDRNVTEQMLNAFTADSRDDRKWPAEYNRAFCKATGDTSLLSCFATLSGLHVISAEDQLLLELGRQVHTRNQAEAQIAALYERLNGRSL